MMPMLVTSFFCMACLILAFVYKEGLMEDKLLLNVSPSEIKDYYYYYHYYYYHYTIEAKNY